MCNKIIHLNDDHFEQHVLQHKGMILVDFWAEWCVPCKNMEPILEEIFIQFHDKIKFVKINTEKNPLTIRKYNIRSIPALFLFHDGQVIDNLIGLISKEQLQKFLNKNL